MRIQNNVGQRLSSSQRMFLLLCVLLLFVFAAIVLFWTPNVVTAVYADVPTDTPTSALPTDTPTSALPTNTPVPPTPTPVPPTPTPVPPTPTPVPPTPTPGRTPTAIIQPTSTSAAGGVPGSTPSPTPTPTAVKAKTNSSGLPPKATNAVPSPTANTTNSPYIGAALPGQDNEKMFIPSAPAIFIGTSVLGAAALIGWYVWRRRQDSLLLANYSSVGGMQQFDTPAPLPYVLPVSGNSSIGMVGANEPIYQTSMASQETLPATPLSSQSLLADADMSLEAIIQQAQQGLFALPNKEEYS